MKLPNFFIVGAPKCGTTALHTYLSRHPDVYMSAMKESHHFATDLLPDDDPYRSVDKYLELFEDAQDERLIGESSVFYLYSREAARNICEFDPHAKIIVMVRHPIDWIFSYHAQLVFNLDENVMDLREALEAEYERKKGKLVPCNVRFAERFFYREVGRFSEQIQRYFGTFGRDSVHVIPYDYFKQNTSAAYMDTLEFLGLGAPSTLDLDIINARKTVRSRTLQKVLAQPPVWLRSSGRRLVPKAMRDSLKMRLNRLNTRYAAKQHMYRDLEEYLQGVYGAEVKRLEDLLGQEFVSPKVKERGI